MKWTGPNQGKLRTTLLDIYPSTKLLRRFVRDNFDYSLVDLAADASPVDWAADLLEKAASAGWIDELYQKFCEVNLESESIVKLQGELQGKPLFSPSTKVEKEDWIRLFDNFSVRDFAYVQIAFLSAFKIVHDDFWRIRPDHPSLTELDQIHKLMVAYDNPKLAVRFVEDVIVALQNNQRDVTALRDWRDRISQKHNIALEEPKPVNSGTQQGYLLVALKESGRVTQAGSFVTLFAELHVTEASNPIELDATAVTCPLAQVADHLSELIRKAEEALIPYECGKITLELFLPCRHLEEDVAGWEVQNEQNRPRLLGTYRGFVVRSLERALQRQTQKYLRTNWDLLKKCVEANNACTQFHLEDVCPPPGHLEGCLEKKPGLKLTADLPEDREHRQDIFYDIINAAVPIAIWSSAANGGTAAERETEFDTLLRESRLTDFSDLAHQWRMKRTTVKQLRLLCDCPDRWPSLPDKSQDDDLLVAS